jgi:hypothetical protein
MAPLHDTRRQDNVVVIILQGLIRPMSPHYAQNSSSRIELRNLIDQFGGLSANGGEARRRGERDQNSFSKNFLFVSAVHTKTPQSTVYSSLFFFVSWKD